MRPILETTIEQLPVSVYRTNEELGQAAAADAVIALAEAIRERGHANLILATGNSQLTFLHALRQADGVDWPKVSVFHMDEYIGLPDNHPAGFAPFLRHHIINHVKPGAFYPVPADPADMEGGCRRYEALLREHPVDLVALGYGENGHLAFNDPPYADFDDPVWVKVVKLAEASRRQQVGEGHYPTLDAVPTHAVTLTVPALLAARRMLCIVPEARKANAVDQALHGPITEDCPGSILRQVPYAHLFLDADSARKAFPQIG